jgi:hypothetical protein
MTSVRLASQVNAAKRPDSPVIGGSARSYLTLSTLPKVLQSWDGHPHHRLTMPLQHGFLSLRWPFSAMAVLPGSSALAGDVSTRPGRVSELSWVFVV